jgi:hypothetical protein
LPRRFLAFKRSVLAEDTATQIIARFAIGAWPFHPRHLGMALSNLSPSQITAKSRELIKNEAL